MSLHHAAQHLKAQGRGPDDQLIHMSSKEVAGLQALAKAHGGSLTVNPDTGLPEAGFLDSILPTVVGVGIGVATGNPWLAAGIMGGGTYLNTGDLGKSLMAGLGGYGAGSLGTSLASAGAAGIGASAVDAAVSEAAAQGLTGEAADAFVQEQVASKMAGAGMLDKLGAGLSAVPAGGADVFGGYGNLGMALAPSIMKTLTPEQKAAAPGTEQMIRPYTYAANEQTLAPAGTTPAPGQQQMLSAQYTPGQDTSERTWFKPEYSALPAYKAAEGGLMEEPVVRMAQGGISTLGGYAAGGNPRLLKGPGDGMSDNIPAVIGNKQPARLADGEFVVPADVVSHLGNGSTEAGAKQLYKMMDRIRQQRTGKKKQAPQVNPSKAMPA